MMSVFRSATMSVILALLSLGGSGCFTSKFTNLVPTVIQRNPTGVYPIEMTYKPSIGVRPLDNVRAEVEINREFIPMAPSEEFGDRWEVEVEIPDGQEIVPFRYKLVYQRGGNRYAPRIQSDLSDRYTLRIVDYLP